MAIDFGAFTGGARAAKKDYWDDVRNSQQSLIRDVAVQDGLQLAKDAQDKEAASSYLAPLLLDQQRAATGGIQSDEWYQRATDSILNDEGFKNMTPERQQNVMSNWRAHGVTMAQKLAEAGDAQRALTLNKSMGLSYGPENRASPTDIFNASDLAAAGFVNDEEAGVWRGPKGQVIPSYQGASAVTMQGQPGMTSLLAAQAEEQRRLSDAVRNGTHVEHTDASGNRTYRPKSAIELQLDADKQADGFRQYQIGDALKTGALDINNPDSLRLFVLSSNDPKMGPAIAAYQSQQAATPRQPAAPVVQQPAAPVVQQQPTLSPFQQALAADQSSTALETQRASLQDWLAQLKNTPTAEDREWVNQLLTDNPALGQDEELMNSLLGAFQQ